jgi:diguanylate cyclase (GGDEF)-like protein/PAS domain S-box-containing protein
MLNKTGHYLKQELYDLVQSAPEIFDFLQSGSLDGIWYWDIEHPEHEWMSPSFWRLFGFDPDTKKHEASEWQDLIDQDDLKVALENFNKHCQDPTHPYDQVVRYRHKDGSTVWVRCRGIAIRDESGKPVRMLGAHNDLTALMRAQEELVKQKAGLSAEIERRKEAEKKLEHLATHDSLTALPTRRLLTALLEDALARARRNGTMVAVMFIDLDGFKEVNDKLGHGHGDAVLIEAASRLKRAVREVDTAARIGGDEFVVVLPNIVNPADAGVVARKISKQLSEPVMIKDATASISASIGIAIYPEDGETARELIKRSDQIMYQVKADGKADFRFVGSGS